MTVGVNTPVPEQWSQGTSPDYVITPVPLQLGQGIVPTPLHVGHFTNFANAKFKHEKARSPISNIVNSFLFISLPSKTCLTLFKRFCAIVTVV
jgi:hypothetical protein